ncbi:MAG: hypothetical protein IKB08_02610 [Clostridia bacterium]|nr:hypothetical protein [Clostridia bacterium]
MKKLSNKKPSEHKKSDKSRIKGYSFKCESPFFVFFKKHYCPKCNGRLLRSKVSEIINSESEEAANFNFEAAGITVKGNMKFTHIEFFCADCQKYYTVKETKENILLPKSNISND